MKTKRRSSSIRLILWLILAMLSFALFLQTDELTNQISRYFSLEPKLITSPYRPAPPDWPVATSSYSSKSIIVYDLTRKQILLRKNIDTPAPIASLTKIMTVILALERINNLDDTVKISPATMQQVYSRNASTAGFVAGENVRYIDLLYGTMLPSGGEAALTLAEAVAGSEDEFVKLMNQRAQELGMGQTTFKNPTGLDADGQMSTPRDLVRLLRHALKNPTFRQIFTSSTYQTASTAQHPQGIKLKSSVLSKVNAEEQTDFNILGGKSGTTYAAELCWATLTKKNEREFLVITLKAPLDNLGNPTLYQKMDLLSIMQTIK